ncbi:MAG: UDP-N-acetylglucosamine 4,6-dehydratase (inverting), partial [Pseudanabaena sp.]
FTTVDCGAYYAILPTSRNLIDQYLQSGATKVKAGFSYNSGQNPHFLTINELRSLLKAHVDPSFAI